MAYPDQKDDQDILVPVEDSDRMVGDDEAVTGRVIEPDEDRLVGTDADEPDLATGESGKHRYSGDLDDDPLTEDDQVVLESSDSGPVTPAPAGETVASTAADAGPDRMGEAIPMPSGTAGDPAPADPADGLDRPADVTYPDPVPEPAPAAATPVSNQDWREILAAFVDDPRAATERAASMVDGSLEDLVASLKGEQQSLRSSWQGDGTDTEKLRTALKDYRSLWQRLDGFAHRA